MKGTFARVIETIRRAQLRRARPSEKEKGALFEAVLERIGIDDDDDSPVEVPADRFEMRELLGRGGSAAVYAAVDLTAGHEVAIKRVPWSSEVDRLQLKREFRTLRELNHPNLVQLFHLLEDDDSLFFTMERVDGADFARWIRGTSSESIAANPSHDAPPPDGSIAEVGRMALPHGRGGTVDEGRVRNALRQLVAGLGALHSAGKVHCDIKPSNVLMTRAGRLVVLDLGLVSDAGATLGRGRGTRAYAAPEQLGGGAASPAFDWYAVGVMLYVALTNRLPFSDDRDDRSRATPAVRGLAPRTSRELAELCEGLLESDPARRLGAADVLAFLDAQPPAPSRVAERLQPFVGRERELGELLRLFRRSEGAGAVLIEGEAGVGKTSLVRELWQRIRDISPDAWLLGGRCYPDQSVPFGAFDHVFEQLSFRLRADPGTISLDVLRSEELSMLRSAFPALRQNKGFADSPGISNPEVARRELLFQAVRELFRAVGASRPLVLWIDDLQWIDADSYALVRELRRGPDPPGLFFVGGRRPRQRTASVEDWTTDHVLDLEPLPREEAIDLATQLLAADDGGSANAHEIALAAEGHPLFIGALTRHVRHRTSPSLPSLAEVLEGQWRGVSSHAYNVLVALCVSPAPLQFALIAQVSGVEHDGLSRLLDRLQEERLIRVAVGSAEVYEPFHDLVRDSVLRGVTRAVRRATHVSLIEGLQTTTPGAHEELAIHYRAAGGLAESLQHFLAAAATAEGAYAFDHAARLYDEALQVVSRSDTSAQRRTRLRLADALRNAGRGVEAAGEYLRIAEDEDDPDRRLDLTRQAAEQLLRSGHHEEGLRVAQDVLAQANIHVPQSSFAAVRALASSRLRIGLRGVKRRAAPVRDPQRISRNELQLTMAGAIAPSDVVLAAALGAAAIVDAVELGEPRNLAPCLAFEANARVFFSGMSRGSAELLELAVDQAELSEDPSAHAWVSHWSSTAALTEDHFAASLELARRTQQILSAHGPSRFSPDPSLSWVIELWALYHLGRVGEARLRISTMRSSAESRGDLNALTLLRTGFCSAIQWLSIDRPADALRDTAQLLGGRRVASFDVGEFLGTLGRFRALLYLGDFVSAHALIASKRGAIRASLFEAAKQVRRWVLEAVGHGHVAASFRATRPGRHLRAAEHVAQRLEDLNAGRTAATDGLLLHAGVQTRRGDDRAAARSYRRAAQQFCDLGMLGHSWVAARHAGQLERSASAVTEADGALRALGVANPSAWATMVAPIVVNS